MEEASTTRSPLTVIAGALETLLEDEDGREREREEDEDSERLPTTRTEVEEETVSEVPDDSVADEFTVRLTPVKFTLATKASTELGVSSACGAMGE